MPTRYVLRSVEDAEYINRYVLMSVEDAEYFELLDNIEYKYLRHIIKDNILINVGVNVEHTETQNEEGIDVMRATFTFDLNSNKEWDIGFNFTWTSPFGNKLNKILCDDSDDETEEAYTTEDTEDIYSQPSSP